MKFFSKEKKSRKVQGSLFLPTLFYGNEKEEEGHEKEEEGDKKAQEIVVVCLKRRDLYSERGVFF